MKTKEQRREELRAILKQYDAPAGSIVNKEFKSFHVVRDTHYRDTVKNKERSKAVKKRFKEKLERMSGKINRIKKKKHKHRNDKRFNQQRHTNKIKRLVLKNATI